MSNKTPTTTFTTAIIQYKFQYPGFVD